MRTHKSGSLLLIGGMSVVASALAVWLLFTLRPQPTEARVIALVTPTQSVASQQLRLALHRVGLDAQSLTAAGVTAPEQINALVTAVRTQLASSPDAVFDAEAAVGVARQSVASLERLVQSGTGTVQDVLALGQARAQLTTTTASRDQLVDALFSAGTFALTTAQQTTLTTLRSNRESRTCPVEFLVMLRSDADWAALTSALAAEHIALKRAQTVDASVQTLLADARGESAVATAISNLSTHGTGVLETWNAATAIVN